MKVRGREKSPPWPLVGFKAASSLLKYSQCFHVTSSDVDIHHTCNYSTFNPTLSQDSKVKTSTFSGLTIHSNAVRKEVTCRHTFILVSSASTSLPPRPPIQDRGERALVGRRGKVSSYVQLVRVVRKSSSHNSSFLPFFWASPKHPFPLFELWSLYPLKSPQN